jgi:hypothetical protein
MHTSTSQTRQAGRDALVRVLTDTAVRAENIRAAMRPRGESRPVDLTALRNAESTILSLARTLAIVDSWAGRCQE